MDRLIFHIDVNSAYLSWEAVRHLEKTGEDLREIPAAVGGDPKKRTGIILAKSQPAKKLGVVTGEPVGMALRKCPSLYIVPPDFGLYERKSRAFMEICRRYTPVLEKYSVDECFLDMTGTSLLYPDPVELANTIRREIAEREGFTVNIGIGENKLLAKMASDFEKPNRVHTLFRREIPEKLWPLPIEDLFMTGRATAEKLKRHGLVTVGAVAAASEEFLVSLLGARHGTALYKSANGIDESPVLAEPEAAKGYSVSTTLEENVTDKATAERVFLALSDSVSARMRADGQKAGCVAVSLRTHTFENRTHQKKLQTPTSGTLEIYAEACRLFAEAWDGETPLRLLGISLSQLVEEETGQISFFVDEKREREEKIDRAVDDIRARFGTASVMRGAVYASGTEVGKKYKARAEAQKDEMCPPQKKREREEKEGE